MRPLILVLVVALSALAVPLAASAQDTVLEPRTDRLFIAAGCPQDTPGTCTSTRWLGKAPGDANTNFLTSTTPADHALYHANGQINWRDYASDATIPEEGYVLDADRDIEVAVTVISNVLSANETANVRIQLDTGNFNIETLPAQTQTVTLINPQDDHTFEFDFDIPEELDGVTVKALTVELAVHGVNAQGGYIDQSGGSTVKIPHLVEVPTS